MLRQINQRFGQLGRTHHGANAPLGLWNRNHHAGGSGGDCVGYVIEGDVLIDLLLTMHAPQGRHHHCQHVIGYQGETEPKQRGFGIAQRVDL